MAIAKSSNIASARIIESPKSDFKPYFPNKLLFFAGGFILGIAIPLGILMLKNVLNTKISSREDVESMLPGIPIISEISHSDEMQQLIMKSDSRSVIAEQFRAFRTNLKFTTGEKSAALYYSLPV